MVPAQLVPPAVVLPSIARVNDRRSSSVDSYFMKPGAVVGAVVRGVNYRLSQRLIVNRAAKLLDGGRYRESAGGHFGWSSVENAGELVNVAGVVTGKDGVRVGSAKT